MCLVHLSRAYLGIPEYILSFWSMAEPRRIIRAYLVATQIESPSRTEMEVADTRQCNIKMRTHILRAIKYERGRR